MSEFGVSYPSIREAIRILETEGLVTVRRGNVGGAEVHRPDESSAAYHLGLALQGGRVTLGDLAPACRCWSRCARPSAPGGRTATTRSSPTLTRQPRRVGRRGRRRRGVHPDRPASSTTWSWRSRRTPPSATSSAASWPCGRCRSSPGPRRSPDAATTRPTPRPACDQDPPRIVDEIAAGNADEAERIARAHLAATQALLLERFDDGIVNASSAKALQAIHSSRNWRI